MNLTLDDHDTLASLLQLYRQCKERGETVSLSLDSRDGNNFVTFSVKSIVNMKVRNEIPDEKHTEKTENKCQNMDYQRIVFPAQYKGQISPEESTKILRNAWPTEIVKMISVKKTTEYFDRRCGQEHLQVETFLHPDFTYDSYFARPKNEENWPKGFLPFEICNCKLQEKFNV